MSQSSLLLLRRPLKAAAAGVLALAAVGVLGGCGPSAADNAEACRLAARSAFDAVIAKTLTSDQGQAKLDEACREVSPTDRKVIVDGEREGAMSRALRSTPSP